jgi:hypothetical protein
MIPTESDGPGAFTGLEAFAEVTEHLAREGRRAIDRAIPAGVCAMTLVLAFTFWPRSEKAPVIVAKPTETSPCVSWAPPNRSEPIDLAHRGNVVLGKRSELHAERLEACSSVLRLEYGRVAIHAEDLGGGEIIVKTNLGSARGVKAIFAVEHGDDRFIVDVAEGKVEVTADGRKQVILARQRFDTQAGRSALGDQAVRDLIAEAMEVRAPPALAELAAATIDLAEEPQVRLGYIAQGLIRRALVSLRDGNFDAARKLLRRAGSLSRDAAESAWTLLARVELTRGRPKDALAALNEHARRFPDGSSGAEAAALRIEALEKTGEVAAAWRQAHEIVRRWPNAPEADAAKQWLEKHR